MAFNKDDCHGAYLIFYNSTKEHIKSKNDLITILRESGHSVKMDVIGKYWKSDTKEITYEDYINICRDSPIITKTDLVKALRKMDTNQYGYLDKTEFIKSVATPDSKLSRREISDILRKVEGKIDGKVDGKAEGRINFEELADLLLSNLDAFRKLGRAKIAEKEDKSHNKTLPESERGKKIGDRSTDGGSSRPSTSRQNSLQSFKNHDDNDDDDDDDVMLDTRRSNNKDLVDEVHIEKITSARFEYNEPKNLKTWPKTTLRGCLFLGDISNSNSTIDPNIESHMYKFTINSKTNVFITMNPLALLQKLDLRQVPDLGFVIVNKSEEIVALSIPADATGSVYYSGNLNAGSYTVLPFTTGAKLKSKSNDAKENFNNLRPLKKDTNGELVFTNEIITMLNDIFKICDVDGNGYLNKDEFIWYSSKTSEDEWEEDMWKELKSHVQLHNDELSFTNFKDLIMEEVKQEKGDTAPLFLTFDLFGFTDKCMIEEAFPFSITISVESSDYLAKCFGIHNKTSLIELSLKNFVFNQGEKVNLKGNWRDCNIYAWYRNGRILFGVENFNPASKQTPIRLTFNMEKSKNLTVYKDKLQKNISIASGTKLLAVHGVPIEPKVSISCDCIIRRS